MILAIKDFDYLKNFPAEKLEGDLSVLEYYGIEAVLKNVFKDDPGFKKDLNLYARNSEGFYEAFFDNQLIIVEGNRLYVYGYVITKNRDILLLASPNESEPPYFCIQGDLQETDFDSGAQYIIESKKFLKMCS